MTRIASRMVTGFGIVIPVGDVSAGGTFSLDPVDNEIFEGDETLTVSGLLLLSDRTVTPTEITITDDDAQSDSLLVTLDPTSAAEGDGTVDVGVTVSLNADAQTEDTAITLTVSDGTATSTSPEDYSVSSATVTLTILAGMPNITGTVPITIVDDDIFEDPETLSIAAAAPPAASLTGGSADFTITDNDTSLSVALGVSPSSVAEDVATAPVVTVTATVDGGTFADP